MGKKNKVGFEKAVQPNGFSKIGQSKLKQMQVSPSVSACFDFCPPVHICTFFDLLCY